MMKGSVDQFVQKRIHYHNRTKKSMALLLVCSMAVMVFFSWNMRLYGEGVSEQVFCGIEEHQHDESCYEEKSRSQDSDSANESEDSSSLDSEKVLTCGKEEHTHSLQCFSDPSKVENPQEWMNQLAKLDLNGTPAQNVLAVAESQLGYSESKENYQAAQSPDGLEVKKGYTRYGDWNDSPYEDWNQIFVNFCLSFAKVDPFIFPQEPSAQQLMSKLKELDELNGKEEPQLLFSNQNQDIQPGDLIFLDTNLDTIPDQTGIVQEYKAKNSEDPDSKDQIALILGDYADQVSLTLTDADSDSIAGYAKIPDNASIKEETNSPQDEQTEEAGQPEQKEEEIVLDSKEETVSSETTQSSNRLRAAVLNANALTAETELCQRLRWVDSMDELEGKTFAIVSRNGSYVMGFSPSTSTEITAVSGLNSFKDPKEGVGWTLEKAGEGNVWYLTTTKNGKKQYLTFTYPGFWQQTRANALLEDAPSENAKFEFQIRHDGNSTYFFIKNTAQNRYLNKYNDNLKFAGWESASANSQMEIWGNFPEPYTQLAHDTVSPSSAVINLFDYRVNTSSQNWNENGSNSDTGINTGHTFKFAGHGDSINQWTGRDNGARQGIVQNQLQNGYPVLENGESLDYLFSPVIENENKRIYRNVGDLLSVNAKGYYNYDSEERYAYYDPSTNSFEETTEPLSSFSSNGKTTRGQFFPFNTPQQAEQYTASSNQLNHYFGLTLTTRFLQKNHGYTDNIEAQQHTTFEFSGDDDVWIFIDGILFADLGGVHDRVSVVIDFAEGTVTTKGVYQNVLNGNVTQTKTFEQLGYPKDKLEGGTFKNDTTHTLKFFYLERGGHASNLKLMYNLTDIPVTSITKTDQFGQPLEGVKFAVYPASRTETSNGVVYDYLDKPNGNKVIPAGEPSLDGVLPLENGKSLQPIYMEATDSKGQIIFRDEDSMPYSMDELTQMFGEAFILREIYTPPGYQIANKEILMHITNGVMQAEDPYGTGVWAAANLLVIATNTLYTYDRNEKTDVGQDANGAIQFYIPSDETGQPKENGRLFAIILKRNGAAEGDFLNWHPVYGNTEHGYTVSEKTGMEAVIETLRSIESQSIFYQSAFFHYSAAGMEVNLDVLPGVIDEYYSYQETLLEPQAPVEYYIGYFYTTGTTLDEISTENTVMVCSSASQKPVDKYPGFTQRWGSDIEIPNVESILMFQKRDQKSNMVNGAAFALYKADEDPSGRLYYLADDDATKIYLEADQDGSGSGSAVVEGREASYSINMNYDPSDVIQPEDNNVQEHWNIDNGTTGVITVTLKDGSQSWHIRPAKNGAGQSMVNITHGFCDIVAIEGTGHFDRILPGRYVMREVHPPVGFDLNPTETRVLVNGKGVYAHAGTRDDNVFVGNGPGYISKAMNEFAAKGSMAETLRFEAGFLKVWPDVSFEAVESSSSLWAAHAENEPIFGTIPVAAGTTDQLSQAMTTYIEFDPESEVATYDFKTNPDQSARDIDGQMCQTGEDAIRLYTDVGWSEMEVYQDYLYGSEHHTEGIKYEKLENPISMVFSTPAFVVYADPCKVEMTVIKRGTTFDESGTMSYVDHAQFVLYKTDDQNNILYYSEKETEAGFTANQMEDAKVFESQTQGEQKSFFRLPMLPVGTYYLKEIKAPEGYYPIKEIYEIEVGEPPGQGDQTTDQAYVGVRKVSSDQQDAEVPVSAITKNADDPNHLYFNTDSTAFQYAVEVVDSLRGTNLSVSKVRRIRQPDKTIKTDPLDQVQFRLYTKVRQDDGSLHNYYYESYDSESGPSWTFDSQKAKAFVSEFSSDQKEAGFEIQGIPDGTYYLDEIWVPDGINKLSVPVELVFKDQKLVSAANSGNDEIQEIKNEQNKTTGWKITVVNTGYKLPDTGSSGFTAIICAGGMLMVFAALLPELKNRNLIRLSANKKQGRQTPPERN